VQPYFLQGPNGAIFVNLFASDGGAGRAVILAPPFAEELNRSRHVMAAAARALAARGVACIIPDLYGTGDSAGDFGDGTFDGWLGDIEAVAADLAARGYHDIGLIGLRTGALLAAEAASRIGASSLMFWAPVANGEQFLTQFLRLRVAEAMARGGKDQETTKDLRTRLENGETLEIGGYALTPAMAQALAARKLAEIALPQDLPVHWIEMSQAEPPTLPPAAERAAEALRAKGTAVTLHVVSAPAFWTLQEPEPAPALVARTVEIFAEMWP